ncbi:DUF2812 domain-containing protein [Paenibacillus sp. GCM10012306]|uniref:DUF2812 domain-containing protein n=1 Tax=Paenibacillus sp. GCM10012306 TaxID=3317342 RepID=UPI0036224649
MRKFKFFTSFDKEEKWLGEMAKQGYKFTKKSFWYEFEPATTTDTTIKMDYRTFKKQEDFEDYCALFEDSGWEHITGTKRSGYQYFKKTIEKGNEDIFSDTVSKAGRYKRLSDMWMSLVSLLTPIFIVLVFTNSIDGEALLNPKLLYYTPGLWEKTGAEFWKAFLFETPFAFFRGFSWVLILMMIFLYLIFSIKANVQYQKTQRD